MKLLFDQNLSFKLCRQLLDVFPGSNQVRLLGLAEASDREIWQHAKTNDFVVVSQDADFADMATLYGPPPKVIWLRCSNQPTEANRKAPARSRGSNRGLRPKRHNRLLGNLLNLRSLSVRKPRT
jgi:predicted nuclease of predicted toxin-antitoxin system